ncbi:MAG: hypothetical protein AAGC93_08840 [Cyanobacteria bacterium P01_F01_bin.53]
MIRRYPVNAVFWVRVYFEYAGLAAYHYTDTMIKTLTRRLLIGASTLCPFSALFVAGSAFAQTAPAASPAHKQASHQTGDDLLPLDAASFEVESDAREMEDVSDRINTQFSDDQAMPDEPEGLNVKSLPIIGELVDEEGNFDWGVELPFSVDIGDVEGSTGVVLSTDFATNTNSIADPESRPSHHRNLENR